MSKTTLSRRQMLKVLGLGVAGAGAAIAGGTPLLANAANLTGLGRTVRQAQSQTTLQWMSWGGATGISHLADAIKSNLPDVAAKYATKVVDGGKSDQDVAGALRLALASGTNIPEIVQLNRTQIAEFASAGELLDLGDIYTSVKDNLYAGALELVKIDGQFVAFPFELKSKIFFYRGDVFDKAGVDLTKIVTADDFIAAGQTIMSKVPGAHILNLGPQPANYWAGELISAYPGSIYFADTNGNFTLSSNQAFADTFKFLKSLYEAKITMPVDDWSPDWQPAIVDNKVSGFLLSSWMKGFLPTFAPDQKGLWKVALWPELLPFSDQRYGSEAGGSVMVVPKRSANAKAAADFLSQVFFDQKGAMVPYNTLGLTPMLKSLKDDLLAKAKNPEKGMLSDKDYAALPSVFFGPDYMALELQSYDYVKVLNYDPAASKGLDILTQWLNKYMAGGVDLNGALSGAEDDMKSQIGNPYTK